MVQAVVKHVGFAAVPRKYCTAYGLWPTVTIQAFWLFSRPVPRENDSSIACALMRRSLLGLGHAVAMYNAQEESSEDSNESSEEE